jgi:hypothetical protein
MENLLSYLLTIIFVLSVLHFVYESIIVPSQRMVIRDELFELRDKLRNSYGEYSNDDRKAFELLHNNGINHCLNNLGTYTLLNQFKLMQKLEEEPELKNQAESKISIIKNSQNELIRNSFDEFTKLVEKAYLLNSGGWFFYLFPVALLMAIAQTIKDMILNSSIAQKIKNTVINSSFLNNGNSNSKPNNKSIYA